MGSIFGGSKSKQQSTASNVSYNKAYDAVAGGMTPLLGLAGQGASGLEALLGGDASGLNKYKAATGFDKTLSMGMDGLAGGNAARGLLRSGATSKGLVNYAQGLETQSAGDYMDRLLGLSGLGFNAANALTGAGGYSEGQSQSTSSSKTKSGIGKFLGAGLAGVAGGN